MTCRLIAKYGIMFDFRRLRARRVQNVKRTSYWSIIFVVSMAMMMLWVNNFFSSISIFGFLGHGINDYLRCGDDALRTQYVSSNLIFLCSNAVARHAYDRFPKCHMLIESNRFFNFSHSIQDHRFSLLQMDFMCVMRQSTLKNKTANFTCKRVCLAIRLTVFISWIQ